MRWYHTFHAVIYVTSSLFLRGYCSPHVYVNVTRERNSSSKDDNRWKHVARHAVNDHLRESNLLDQNSLFKSKDSYISIHVFDAARCEIDNCQ